MPLLFSYGTLQQADVQRATFGRTLAGGKSHHNIVRFTGRDSDRISGVALEVAEEDLARADSYEPAGYRRVRGRLASGRETWVYAADRAG